jgi:hypothetical protein
MSPTVDESLHSVLVALVTVIPVAAVVAALVRGLGRSRPGFAAIGLPVAVAFAARVVGAGLISLTPFAGALRGGDELGFQGKARLIAHSPLGSGEWTHALLRELHVFVLAVQKYALDSPELALRVTQVGIAVCGLVLLAATVYELAGRRAAVMAMWLLALEPAGIFFSSLLHKEANMMLAIGLVAFAGARIWKSSRPRYLALIAAGCLIAVATRHYAGWFLIAAGAAIVLHAGLRAENRTAMRSLVLVAVVVLFVAIALPTVFAASTDQSLQKNLQNSQTANASDNSNLRLEQVDFSTRGAIVSNLPKRVFDVLLRPFPWQLGNISQTLGLLGTTSAYLALFFLIRTLIRRRGRIMDRAGPLVYLTFFFLIAYSLSAGNAGTSFRYRVQIVALFICLIATLWSPARQPREERSPAGLAARPRPRGSGPAALPASPG